MSNRQEKIVLQQYSHTNNHKIDIKSTKNPSEELKNIKLLDQIKFLRHQKVKKN